MEHGTYRIWKMVNGKINREDGTNREQVKGNKELGTWDKVEQGTENK
jgi:hypothetical protein